MAVDVGKTPHSYRISLQTPNVFTNAFLAKIHVYWLKYSLSGKPLEHI